MQTDARISFTQLCRQLGVSEIPGAQRDGGGDARPDDNITLIDVEVSDQEMIVHCSRCEDCEDEPDYAPPQHHYLSDWIRAMVGGDIALAITLSHSVFDDPASQAVCERILLAIPEKRRAA